jgi:hypothetical protein
LEDLEIREVPDVERSLTVLTTLQPSGLILERNPSVMCLGFPANAFHVMICSSSITILGPIGAIA